MGEPFTEFTLNFFKRSKSKDIFSTNDNKIKGIKKNILTIDHRVISIIIKSHSDIIVNYFKERVMKRKYLSFLLAILGIILIAGCENGITGTKIEMDSDSRVLTSQSKSKTVTATKYETVRFMNGGSGWNSYISSIEEGNNHYQYSDAQGYSGTLNSYDFDVVSAPYLENGYRVYQLKIYYRGTVYKD